jgi:positive regulator of sigma E activity
MEIAWGRVLPVIVSIIIIIAVAILREYSRTLAAIAATMPINLPLALWIIYGGGADPSEMEQFTRALLINIWPTIVFIMIVWLTARAGWHLVPMITAGYVGWAVTLGIVALARQASGV